MKAAVALKPQEAAPAPHQKEARSPVQAAAPTPAKKPGKAKEPAPQLADLSDLSDLASEIDAALSGAGEADQSLLQGVEATPEGHSLEEIVQAFRKGIEQQIDSDDFDTHYNLGIAYKEMGLMDEAIGEFQFAAKDARRMVDCCSMLGICFREKGMSALAVKWYRKGLEAGASNDEETMLGMRYDLAELLVEMGEHRQAMDLFTEVFGINSKYRDVASRMKDLERQLAR
jgi:tetratricopeptide (TPR) repeat protein